VAGDFSPLTIDPGHAGARFAPPALVVAAAMGLGTMDMPVPSVDHWEWVNWKFPKPVRAGDTIYARWTLTQKRPTVGGAPTGIVVWRVDVHTSDGAMCAEGEVGATVRRAARHRLAAETPAAAPASVPASRRRRGRRTAKAAEPAPPPPVEAPVTAPAAEKTGSSRRRRRRRPRAGVTGQNGPVGAAEPAAPAAPTPAAAPAPVAKAAAPAGTLSRVIKRLRRT
jgi:acyl dehydratase